MSNMTIGYMEKLCTTFPKLTEPNQQYILGLAEGLKKAQNGRIRGNKNKTKTDPRK